MVVFLIAPLQSFVDLHILLCFNRMPRKLRLCHKKRYYLKPLSLVVSIPQSLITIPNSDLDVPSLPPSLPMSDAYSVSSPDIRLSPSLTVSSTYTFGILESLKCLEVRIQRAGLLPKGT